MVANPYGQRDARAVQDAAEFIPHIAVNAHDVLGLVLGATQQMNTGTDPAS